MKCINYINKSIQALTKFEWSLWIGSIAVIVIAFITAGKYEPLTLLASILGITSLIFTAKGDFIGPLLIIFFSLIYAFISYQQHYYGEIITYVGMSAPIAGISAVNWIRHPYSDTQVKVSSLTKQKLLIVTVCTIAVTIAFYFILKYFGTASLIISTISVTTSFYASALMLMRSPFYALAYSANDIVLILLWVIASMTDIACLPMVVCFAVFLVNDLYGLLSWQKMKKNQTSEAPDD